MGSAESELCLQASVNMLTTILLSALLMQGGAAVSDLQVYGKTIQSEKTLMSSDHDRLTVRRQPHVQVRNIYSIGISY